MKKLLLLLITPFLWSSSGCFDDCSSTCLESTLTISLADNANTPNDLKLQGGIYAYLNWLDYRDIFQMEHFYGVYEQPIKFKETFPSFLAHFALLHQLGGNIEVAYAFQVSTNKVINNVRKGFYYIASTGKVGQTGIAAQFHLNFKYAIFRSKG